MTPPSRCGAGWEALVADPLPQLLDPERPAVLWRTLVELVGRPASAPAVVRARGGASASEPIASLLEQLLPDGRWATGLAPWARYAGPGWRLLAAVQLGADPDDPRLVAGLRELVASLRGEGGVTAARGAPPAPCLTARVVEAMARTGLDRLPRVEEAVAWLEEAPPGEGGGWQCPVAAHRGPGGCRVTAVALLEAAGAGAERVRDQLVRRSASALAASPPSRTSPGAVNLLRSDDVEAMHALAVSGASWREGLRPSLERVQRLQVAGARWRPARPPRSLPLGAIPRDQLAPWVTLRAVVALLRFAVEAGLPRRFPRKPGS